jgi:hypothetical protein
MKTYTDQYSYINSELTVKFTSGNGTVTGDVKTYNSRTGEVLEDSSGEVASYDMQTNCFYWTFEIFSEDGEVMVRYNFKANAN